MRTTSEQWVEEYWSWIAAALYSLFTLDLLTSVFAATRFGLEQEANPIMRWALSEGMIAVLAVQLLAITLLVGMFYGLLQLVQDTADPYRPYFRYAVEAYIGLLLSAGLFVFANNLSVIFFGQSLV